MSIVQCKPTKRRSLWLSVTALLLMGWWVIPHESFTAGWSNNNYVADRRSHYGISLVSRRQLPIMPPIVSTQLQAKKSMAEKRRKRGARHQPLILQDSSIVLPPANLESQRRPSSDKNNIIEQEENTIAGEAGSTTGTGLSSSSSTQRRTKVESSSSSSPQTKAQQLLASQRESVALLTAVRQAVERLPREEIRHQLNERGYWYCDHFLQSAASLEQSNHNPTHHHHWINAMMEEGVALCLQESPLPSESSTTLTTEAAAAAAAAASQQEIPGSGEFVASLMGGPEQYQIAPRSIEWVVSVTKHVPALQLLLARDPPSSSSPALPTPDPPSSAQGIPLSSVHCMATMRTLDRNVRKASWKLLTGQDLDDDDDNNDTTPIQLPPRRAGRVVTDPTTDRRRLSLYYYLVPETWDATCGGGLTFFVGDDDRESITVAAQRDRLILFRSDTTSVRSEPWHGRRDLPHGSCIELHLLAEPMP